MTGAPEETTGLADMLAQVDPNVMMVCLTALAIVWIWSMKE